MELLIDMHPVPVDGQPAGQTTGMLMTVEQVAVLWFGEVGAGGSASSNCQRIRRLIPETLPARRIGNRWYVNRATAEAWAAGRDHASVMAHPDSRAALDRATRAGRERIESRVEVQRRSGEAFR